MSVKCCGPSPRFPNVRTYAHRESKICIRKLPWSATTMWSSRVYATPHGCRNCPSPPPSDPSAIIKMPSELNTCTRLLWYSHTAISPLLLTATSTGTLKHPGATPSLPNARTNAPSWSKILTRCCALSATTTMPPVLIATPTGTQYSHSPSPTTLNCLVKRPLASKSCTRRLSRSAMMKPPSGVAEMPTGLSNKHGSTPLAPKQKAGGIVCRAQGCVRRRSSFSVCTIFSCSGFSRHECLTTSTMSHRCTFPKSIHLIKDSVSPGTFHPLALCHFSTKRNTGSPCRVCETMSIFATSVHTLSRPSMGT
mmetsp:Transcript_57692/g.141507  ORF Transcript_57692/g.141507 Transcript_57692/m.141507 type:complete len:308 (-) Transcript_57692:757-1680(-)